MKFVTVSIVFTSIGHEVMGQDLMIFIFWVLNFKPACSLYSFTFIKELFNFSLFSAIRVLSSAYLRLLIFLPVILIPACASSSLAFHTMYSAYKLNKQDGKIYSIKVLLSQLGNMHCSMSSSAASWPAYRFLRREVRWSSIPITWRISHSLLWSTQSKALVYSMKRK